jgi:hypothetical protein
MSFEKRFFAVLGLTLAICCLGCTPPSDPLLEMMDAEVKKTKVDDLSRTIEFVFSEIRFSQKEFRDKISTGLNRWVSTSDERLKDLDSRWTMDEMSKPLFDASQTLELTNRNDELSFLSTDAYYLQESAWVTQIAERVMDSNQLNPFELYRLAADNYKPEEDAENVLVDVVAKLHPNIEEKQSETLAESLAVFDWVVRNIQLNADPNLTEDEIEEAKLIDNDEGLAASGVPGLGYTRYPWQVLLYGRGDYVERAKLFMLGLRHLGIDSVMLSVKDSDGNLRPWAVGVAVGSEYYLFDTKLGLPISGEAVGSIATLTQVREDSDLIRSLDLTNEESLEENTDYWVTEDQLKDLEGFIYVSPESVSKRMLGLESSLVGDNKLTLAFKADDIASRLPETEGVEIKPWDIAFKTHQFRQAVRFALEQTSNNVMADKLIWYYTDEYYIDNFVVYRTARARFFKGKFSVDPRGLSLSAIQSCQRLNYTDEQIENLGSDRKQQRRLGIRKEADQDVQSFNREVKSVQAQMRLIKRDAGLYLSQCLFDNGSMNASANWLEILRKQGASRWDDAVTYLLGRSHEKLKDYDKAIEVLSNQKVAQSHGNILRVRMLKKLISELE